MATWFSEGMRLAQRAAEDAARRRAAEAERAERDEAVETDEKDGKA